MVFKMPSVTQAAERLTKRRAMQDVERLVIDVQSSGAFLALMDVAGSPKIRRTRLLRFDEAMTDTERRHAYQSFFKECGLGPSPKTILTWSDAITFRQLIVPEMPQEDLMKAIAWDLKKKFFFEASENLFGYEPVMSVETDEGPQKLFNVYYCESKTAIPRLEFFSSLGLEILAFVPTNAALARFSHGAETNDRDILVCDVNASSVRILVVRKGVSMLARNVSITLEDGNFTDAVLSKVAEEVHKTADYYEGQKYARPVGKALFTGIVESNRLLDFMTSRFSFPVTVPEIASAVEILPAEEKEGAVQRSGLFASCLGAVLPAPDSLNLLPPEMKTRNRQKLVHHWLNMGLIVTLLVLGGIVGMTALAGRVVEMNVASLEKEYQEINDHKKIFEHVISQSKVRRAARTGDIPVHAFLKELANRTPTAVNLLEIDYNRLEGSVLIRGQMTEMKREYQKIISQFASSLAESAFIESANTDSVSPDEGASRVDFVISCKIKGFA